MYAALYKILVVIIAVNFFTVGLLVVFLINARMNLRRKINKRRVFIKTYNITKTVDSSEEAAKLLNITRDEFITYCKENRIELPEEKKERTEKQKKTQEEEQKRIVEEEAAWRAEQECIVEERRIIEEEEARKRRERLRKFGL